MLIIKGFQIKLIISSQLPYGAKSSPLYLLSNSTMESFGL